jgi:hypothetical protein
MKILRYAAIIALVLFGAYKFLGYQTKKASPEKNVSVEQDGAKIDLFYCAPSVKGRTIFGELVPFDADWRTGANEPTTFTTSKALDINGVTLKPGKYSLFTVPYANGSWDIVLNNKEYPWGISWGGKSVREPASDVVVEKVTTKKVAQKIETLDIHIEKDSVMNLYIGWENTEARLPFTVKK